MNIEGIINKILSEIVIDVDVQNPELNHLLKGFSSGKPSRYKPVSFIPTITISKDIDKQSFKFNFTVNEAENHAFTETNTCVRKPKQNRREVLSYQYKNFNSLIIKSFKLFIESFLQDLVKQSYVGEKLIKRQYVSWENVDFLFMGVKDIKNLWKVPGITFVQGKEKVDIICNVVFSIKITQYSKYVYDIDLNVQTVALLPYKMKTNINPRFIIEALNIKKYKIIEG